MLLPASRCPTMGSEKSCQHVQRMRSIAASLATCSDAELGSMAEGLRESLDGDSEPAPPHVFALAVEALRRTVGLELYDVQLMAARALSAGRIAEMATGEGKSLAAVPAAIVAALRGQSVHLATPNAYLASRDHGFVQPAFDVLGISVGLLPDQHDASAKQAAYQCEVTYGTGYEFGFDYLRDQLAVRSNKGQPLGTKLLERLDGKATSGCRLQRDHAVAIVDEVDNVLIDDAGSPLILSDSSAEGASDADACLLARQLALELHETDHYELTPQGAVLSPQGREFIYASGVPIPTKQLKRPWDEYVNQALRAQHHFHRDAHYVIADGQVRIVDNSTGRIFSDRSWSDGLHQAVEAKERVAITEERTALAQVTRQRYYRQYACLSGMTGTAAGCQREFRQVYKTEVEKIPRRLACRRKVFPTRAFVTEELKWLAIAEEISQRHRQGQPVLVGTRTIAHSERLADILRAANLEFQLLNGRQDAEEASIVAEAGMHGAITIATNLAGRGTDIRLDQQATAAGGLHVVVSEPHPVARVDRQLIGRGARQGDPGSAATFLCAEDLIIRELAPRLIRPIQRCADPLGEVPLDLTNRIRRIQWAFERRQAAARMALLKRDLARDNLVLGSRR